MSIRIGLTAAMFAAALTAAQPAAAATGDTHTFVTSFDGTRLQVHLMRTDRVSDGGTAPTVMIAHGFGETAPSDPDAARLAGAPTVRPVLDAGYNVLTWDARGHGGSQGSAMFDSPDFEVRDTQAVIDWASTQPGVQLDGPGDPRVGMVGASYGGIIQFLTAAVDRRVDVIAPGYTANNLAGTSLAKNDKFKEGWGLALAGMGGVGNVPAGLVSPLGPQLHGLDPESVTGLTGSILAGTVTPAFKTYLDVRSPHAYLDRVNVPTLIQGGTSDTLFPLENLVNDFLTLKARGVPVKLAWNCEGHSLCPGNAGPLEAKFNSNVIAWMDRWLKEDRRTDTGPQFEWIADNEGSYRSAVAYPAKQVGALRGRASGLLPLTAVAPLSSPGFVFLGAQPALVGLNVPISAPASDSDVVGFPVVNLTYTGTALPRTTWVYAQILDKKAGRIVGVQVTPIPLTLDGKRRVVTLDLNAIATRATVDSQYVLQLVSGSAIFGLQRSTGAVTFNDIQVSLPVIDPTHRG